MLDKLSDIQREALAALEGVHDENALQQWKVTYLGRSSPLMQTFDKMGQMTKEESPAIGRRANEVKNALEKAQAEKSETLRQQALQRSLQESRLDVTLPGRPQMRGRLHPAT